MNLIQNYILETKKATRVNNNTGYNTVQTTQNQKPDTSTVTELNNVTADYNVKTPISYKYIEDVKLNNNLTAKAYKLANGQKIVIVPKDGTTVVKTYVNTGSFNEKDNIRGISHYIEHNLFNGSEDLGDKVFFDEVNKMGADSNAGTSYAETNYYIESSLLEDTDLEEQIKLHAGMVQSPKFLLEKLEKEKNIVNSEINMYMSEDDTIGFNQTIKNLFNIKSTSTDLIAGTTNNITNLTREDVVNYYNNNYYPANMTTVITGEVDPDKTMELVSKYFNAKNKITEPRHFETLTPTDKQIRQDIVSPKSQGAATVYLGFAGPKNNDTKDKIHSRALNILASGLENSRCLKLEQKYGYPISFNTERLSSKPSDPSIVQVISKIPEEKTELFLKELYTVLDKLSKVPPTEEEMSAIKNKLKKTNNKILEISAGINRIIGSAYLNNTEHEIKDFNDIVDAMTPQDIVNAAKKYLDLNKSALTVIHPNGTTPEQINTNYKTNNSKNISFTGINKKTPLNLSDITSYNMSNNFEIIFNDTNSDVIDYNFELSEKYWTPKKAATAILLNDTIQNCQTKSHTHSSYLKTCDTLGISSIISINNFGLMLGADFPIENTKKALELFNEKILTMKFNPQVVEKNRKRLQEVYSLHEGSAFDQYNKAIFAGQPLSFSSKDILNSLKDVTVDDLKAYYNEILTKSQGSVVVSGPFSKHPELKQQVFEAIAQFKPIQPKDVSQATIFKPIDRTEVYTLENKKNQAHILEGFKFKNSGNIKDKTAIALLNEILGGSSSSRLFSDLRENRHLAYMVSSKVSYEDDIGVLTLGIKTTTENQETGEKSFDNIKKSIDGFNENIEKLLTQKVTDDELRSAKRALKTTMLQATETNSSKNDIIASSTNSLYGLNYINKYIETIDQITAEDILSAAKYIFGNKPTYSISATKDSIATNKTYLESLK